MQKDAINALNSLIYNERRKKQGKIHYSDQIKRFEITNNIDQFMISNIVDKILMPFDDYINNGAYFLSQSYKIACEAIFQKEPCPTSDLDIARQAIANFNLMLKSK
jgi:hypothetical protein